MELISLISLSKEPAVSLMELISEPTVSLMELISFLKSTVGSKSFLMFFKSEIDFFTSLRSFSSANSFKEFLKSREIFFSDLENEPICFKRLGISFGPTTIITTITVSAISVTSPFRFAS